MKKSGVLVTVFLVLSLMTILLFGGCSPANPAKLKVVTSTSLIAQIVERVGGDRVDVINIIPPTQCPGHFDVKPGDIQKLADADLFLLHGWQGEKFSEKLIASANNPDLTVVSLDVKAPLTPPNWAPPPPPANYMIPAVQREATDKVATALSQVDTENSAVYQESAKEYKNEISAKEAEIKAKLNQMNPSEVSVICGGMQARFVQWAGFNVIATYGRSDSLTPQVVKELVDKGKEEKVTLIIDNMQSGKDAGKGIAEELGCNRIILSNFPGGFDDTETWEKAIAQNIELILEAISQ
ncbi:MAG TPA: metal ABC transporter substrate-binding protein [Dehalococcoidales bacterium]|nr:metal ABC transporter substrate-binding protein [Dehalococcoidales bacterium]